MAKQKKPPRPAKSCVFCGVPGVTKEHYLPEWLDTVLPPRQHTDINTQVRHRFSFHADTAFLTEPHIHTRQGHTRTRKVRFVCKRCNGGWMGGLQTLARPTLTPLILGQNSILDEGQRRTLSTWAVMTTMSAEFTDPATVGILQQQRDWLSTAKSPPEGWYIWIGSYLGSDWDTRLRHHALALAKAPVIKRPDRYNTQTTTLTVGRLVLHTVSSTVSFVERPDEFTREFAKTHALQRLWPLTADDIDWGKTPVLTDNNMTELADWAIHAMLPRPGQIL